MFYEARLTQRETVKFLILFYGLEVSKYLTLKNVPDIESKEPEYDGMFTMTLCSKNSRLYPLENIFQTGPLRDFGWHEKFERRNEHAVQRS